MENSDSTVPNALESTRGTDLAEANWLHQTPNTAVTNPRQDEEQKKCAQLECPPLGIPPAARGVRDPSSYSAATWRRARSQQERLYAAAVCWWAHRLASLSHWCVE